MWKGMVEGWCGVPCYAKVQKVFNVVPNTHTHINNVDTGRVVLVMLTFR